MKREIIKLPIQSFCFGVRNAIDETNRIINNPNTIKPIHMLGEIVHNKYVSEYFENNGVIVHKEGKRIEMINIIENGSVIFTAHGVSSEVINQAIAKKLPYYNTTCPFVKNSIKVIQKYLHDDYIVLYIGSDMHPEVETALSFGDKVKLIQSLDDVNNLTIASDKICVTNQTTMSTYDIAEIVEALKIKYPHLVIMEKVCNAAKERQEMIKNITSKHKNDEATAFIIVGDSNSHNSKKLADIISKYNNNIYFIETVNDLNLPLLDKFNKIYIGSGTSTPRAIIDEVYETLLDNSKIRKPLTLEDYIK
ncbi:MAG: 4-hydroxy-3-methylbut-2-enyl diphosphate reductase [Bacilli bacterium]|nr:4-hydroxy-3-methylbut-2-enyl diphosphate reductase [Bacilli bacterium]